MAHQTAVVDLPSTVPPSVVPPLHAGDHLSRCEFERRYEAHPEIKKAELLEGIVYMPSPARFTEHAQPHGDLVTWLGTYRAATPGVLLGDNATVLLDWENEPQPDALLRIDEVCGGRSRVTAEHYLAGAPELMLEVAASSASYDLHTKRRVYQRNGVEEYVVVQMYERRIVWFRLREGIYHPIEPDAASVLSSEVFPGLCLHQGAFWAGDMARVLTVLHEQLASPGHTAFVASLQARRQTAREP